jgi:phosphoglucomutase
MNDITSEELRRLLDKARAGIAEHLDRALSEGHIDQQLHADALRHTFPELRKWLECPEIEHVSDRFKKGIAAYVEGQRWEEIINAFRQEVRFGTGGIRGMMAFDKASIVRLKDEGIEADILKGSNTINDLVFLKTTAGVARFGEDQEPRLRKVVVGYDSRIRGYDFAKAVAEVLLAYGYTVYFFDAPCPYPEVTYAIPDELIKADIGVLISASHNDYRYNGYKLSCANGSQFDPEERDRMYDEYIGTTEFGHIRLLPFSEAPADRLWFLGGDEPVHGFDYAGREDRIINMHARHREHIKTFLLARDTVESQATLDDPLHIGYCAFHGSGNVAVPRLLREVGFVDVKPIDGKKSGMRLNQLDGLFPAFSSEPGREQQPDPGDPRAADIAVKAFKEDYPGEFASSDIIIGTDPDADRCGITVKVPPEQGEAYGNLDYWLLPADDIWTLVLWYRLTREMDSDGRVRDADRKFVALSHTTTDAVTLLARKHGLGALKSWVGFAALAASTRDVWDGKVSEFAELVNGRDSRHQELCHPFVYEAQGMNTGKRSFNVAAMEQSNGFSILGGPPPDARSLGTGGHVRDKDGTFAAMLVAEVAAWAKTQGTDLIGLLDEHIYLDPDIGLFATFYEPDPLDGEYPGIEGDRIKKGILLRTLELHRQAQQAGLEIAGLPVLSSAVYRTGKYDHIYPPSAGFQFPDEGVRLFLSEDRLQHLTIRPSGTGNSLRFHIQFHTVPTRANLVAEKVRLRKLGKKVMNELRRVLNAPRR